LFGPALNKSLPLLSTNGHTITYKQIREKEREREYDFRGEVVEQEWEVAGAISSNRLALLLH
jgi:hypothetical protein